VPNVRIVAVLVGLWALLWWLPFVVEPPGRDQSLFMAQAQAWLDGASLYTEIWEHKPPGVIFAYALAQFAFGRSFIAIHFLDGLAGLVTALTLAGLVLHHTRHRFSAIGAAMLYLVYHSGAAFGGFWCVSQAEVLMDPLLAGALAVLVVRSGPISFARALTAGVLVAAVIGLKYSALPLVLLIVPVLLQRSSSRKAKFVAFAGGALGVAVPALLWSFYLYSSDRFAAFWSATVTFNRAHGSIATQSRVEGLPGKLLFEFDLLAPLYLLAVAALVAATMRRSSGRLLIWGGWSWLLCLAAVFWQGKFWGYHYHVILLPLCVIAGGGLAELREKLTHAIPRAIAATVLLLSFVPYAVYLGGYSGAHQLAPRLLQSIESDEFLSNYRWGGPDYDVFETMRVAERLRAETSPEDRIFVWGFEAGIYVFAERRSASRFYYDYPLMPRFESVHRTHVDWLMEDLNRHRPKRIVILRRDANDIEEQGSVDQMRQIPRLAAFTDEHYEPAWAEGDFFVLRRRER